MEVKTQTHKNHKMAGTKDCIIILKLPYRLNTTYYIPVDFKVENYQYTVYRYTQWQCDSKWKTINMDEKHTIYLWILNLFKNSSIYASLFQTTQIPRVGGQHTKLANNNNRACDAVNNQTS